MVGYPLLLVGGLPAPVGRWATRILRRYMGYPHPKEVHGLSAHCWYMGYPHTVGIWATRSWWYMGGYPLMVVYGRLPTLVYRGGYPPWCIWDYPPPWVYQPPTIPWCTAVHVRAEIRCRRERPWAQRGGNPWVGASLSLSGL